MRKSITKYLTLTGILITLFSTQLFSQDQIDSLKQLLSTQKGKDRIATLISLSQHKLYFDSKQAKEYASEALSLSEQYKNEDSKADSYYYLGFSEYRLGNYQEALKDLEKATDVWSGLKKYNSVAIAKNLTAIINYYIGRYEISTKLYSQNLVYYKQQNNMIYYSKMLTNLATVYSKKGNYNKALENLLLAKTNILKYAPNDAYLMGNLLCNIGEAYFGRKEIDSALNNYFGSLIYLKRIGLTDAIANTQMDIGLAYLETKNYVSAIDYFNQALNKYYEINYTKGVMEVRANIIKYYKEIKKPDLALKENHTLELTAINANDTIMLATSYSHYADIYESTGNYAMASKYFKKYFMLQDVIKKQEEKNNFIGLQVLTDAEEKEMENMALRQENELQKERLKRSTFIFISIVCGIILLTGFLFILYKKEKNISKYTLLLEKKNDEIKIQNEKLEEVILSKDKFFSILAHNLKNPFWALIGLNDMLDEDYDEVPDSEKREIISQMGISIKNVYRLFEDLLSWAKTQQSAIKPVKEKLAISELINNSIKPYQLRAKEKGVDISTNIDDNISLHADKFMLETVIGNLVDNAIKFSKENSKVQIEANLDQSDAIISIKDSGIGMSGNKIEKLFKIGENISSEGTQNEKGTGLGLIICKEFIKLNNGEVAVESEIDKGTKFTIKLPIE